MNVLIFAPHPDDEVLGCGGTIYKRSQAGNDVYVCIVTRGPDLLFDPEDTRLTREQCVQADKLLGVKETIFLDFPSVMLETVPRYELNGKICGVVQQIKPDEVYIPHRGDMQQDHKIVVDACMVALRPKYEHKISRIYSYETLSETGWDIPNTVNEFIPTVYENITDQLLMKTKAMDIFKVQLEDFPAARSVQAVEALARYRGATVGVEAAEAFSLVREYKG